MLRNGKRYPPLVTVRSVNTNSGTNSSLRASSPARLSKSAPIATLTDADLKRTSSKKQEEELPVFKTVVHLPSPSRIPVLDIPWYKIGLILPLYDFSYDPLRYPCKMPCSKHAFHWGSYGGNWTKVERECQVIFHGLKENGTHVYIIHLKDPEQINFGAGPTIEMYHLAPLITKEDKRWIVPVYYHDLNIDGTDVYPTMEDMRVWFNRFVTPLEEPFYTRPWLPSQELDNYMNSLALQ